MKYQILGGSFPVAVCDMNPGEAIICQAGGMSWIRGDIRMETKGGGLGKMFGRAISGESMFQNRYAAHSQGQIAFAASVPGEIRAIQVSPGCSVIAQKGSFLASDEGVELSVYLQKKAGAGFFGGEGFVMQKFAGSGTVLVEIDGSAVEYDLAPGEQITIDTGYLVLMDESCKMDIVTVKGLGNKLFGGEGFFNTVVTGPGKVVLQTMPISALAGRISAFIPTGNG